jgi:hypothetical protein
MYMYIHTYIVPTTQEVEIRGSWVEASLGKSIKSYVKTN